MHKQLICALLIFYSLAATDKQNKLNTSIGPITTTQQFVQQYGSWSTSVHRLLHDIPEGISHSQMRIACEETLKDSSACPAQKYQADLVRTMLMASTLSADYTRTLAYYGDTNCGDAKKECATIKTPQQFQSAYTDWIGSMHALTQQIPEGITMPQMQTALAAQLTDAQAPEAQKDDAQTLYLLLTAALVTNDYKRTLDYYCEHKK